MGSMVAFCEVCCLFFFIVELVNGTTEKGKLQKWENKGTSNIKQFDHYVRTNILFTMVLQVSSKINSLENKFRHTICKDSRRVEFVCICTNLRESRIIKPDSYKRDTVQGGIAEKQSACKVSNVTYSSEAVMIFLQRIFVPHKYKEAVSLVKFRFYAMHFKLKWGISWLNHLPYFFSSLQREVHTPWLSTNRLLHTLLTLKVVVCIARCIQDAESGFLLCLVKWRSFVHKNGGTQHEDPPICKRERKLLFYDNQYSDLHMRVEIPMQFRINVAITPENKRETVAEFFTILARSSVRQKVLC